MSIFGENCPKCGCYISNLIDSCPACGQFADDYDEKINEFNGVYILNNRADLLKHSAWPGRVAYLSDVDEFYVWKNNWWQRMETNTIQTVEKERKMKLIDVDGLAHELNELKRYYNNLER